MYEAGIISLIRFAHEKGTLTRWMKFQVYLKALCSVTLVIFALLTSKIAQIREDFQAATFEGQSEANSEGQVKYCRGRFFGHATPDRAGARPARSMSGRAM